MSSTKRQSANGTANRDAFRKSFLLHVHHLLQLGYESLAPEKYTDAEEDVITGEICKRMEYLTEEAPTEKWMPHFSIHDQKPLNDKLEGTTGKKRQGKHRPRLDIRLLNHSQTPKPGFCVEAKRLYRSDSVAEYMDDEGVGAFVSGYYAERDDSAGVLGYVQKDSVAEWLTKLEKKLSTDASLQKAESGQIWQRHVFKCGPTHTYKSLHRRGNGAPIMEIFHSLFAFSGRG
jgi:hypothetical protein